jgi:hypothetical protein
MLNAIKLGVVANKIKLFQLFVHFQIFYLNSSSSSSSCLFDATQNHFTTKASTTFSHSTT